MLYYFNVLYSLEEEEKQVQREYDRMPKKEVYIMFVLII